MNIWSQMIKSKTGFVGFVMLSILVGLSIFVFAYIPDETTRQWNNVEYWINLPKAAVPAWINWFITEKIPEHQILRAVEVKSSNSENIKISSERFLLDYKYDAPLSDFIYEYTIQYSGAPILQLTIQGPDGVTTLLKSVSLPYGINSTYTNRIFSTDESLRKNIQLQSMNRNSKEVTIQDIFLKDGKTIQGNFIFTTNMYGVQDSSFEFVESRLIIGGKVYGVMGTDELRRDLAIGLLWGTPLALLIGITVAVGSVVLGLFYGIYAGYKKGRTDEVMMRFNDVIYALPVLPFLIILAVTISSSIFLIMIFLLIFGWVGVAKVSRSITLQVRNRGFVLASKNMGQRDFKIIFKHIVPQLLPYAFASIAISVPAAITTEAGLSFLGLGDPTFPTWGNILHDANIYGAAIRGMWWWIVPPGVMIAITGLAFVFIGNAMDKILNPKRETKSLRVSF
ncbi:MAG: ABC transporter permease [Candidatus Nitrosoabyssus spongiisocia]|nr:MAG: ABC transporter permease [Nitrosopumilaceae archaeon AB1(1)]